MLVGYVGCLDNSVNELVMGVAFKVTGKCIPT